jgi:hypothetical protein
MPGRIDQALVDELLGGDPLLLPDEAAGLLGIDVDDLTDRARAGEIPCVQVTPDAVKARGARRYRTSVITALAEKRNG